MPLAWQLAAGGLTPTQQAVRDRFQQGGSVTETLFVFLAMIFAVLLLYLLTLWSRKNVQRRPNRNPRKLFIDVLSRLGLSPQQRELLTRMAADLCLKDPTAILVSRALFDKHVEEWWAGQRRSGQVRNYSINRQLLAQARHLLFATS